MIQYNISFPQVTEHYVKVQMHIDATDKDEINLIMPVWTPGSYMVREFSKNVDSFQANAPTRKTNKYTWTLDTSETEVLIVDYDVYAFEISVRHSYVDEIWGFLHGVSVFMYADGLKDDSIELNLTKNMKNGSKVVIKNGGDELMNSNLVGDLILDINIKDHLLFKRINNELFLTKDILLSEALCGCKFIINHMDKRKILVNLDKIIYPNNKQKIIGEGMTIDDDLIINFNIKFPNSLSNERKKYLKKLLPINNSNLDVSNMEEAILVDYAENSNEDIDNEDNENNENQDENGVNCVQQ